jgi:4-methyl-5(b-hydroxyethyl)-thiazole monophosphate biosynthesis
MEEKLDYTLNAGAQWSKERVVVDGNLITSRAAGTAGAFSAAIIERLAGKEAAGRIAAAVLL